MIRPTPNITASKERTSLRGRVRRFYEHFNRMNWQRCFNSIDPRLRDQGKVDISVYAESLEKFVRHYGKIKIWHIDINLHLNESTRGRDDRDFAYVYIFWQEQHHA